MSTILRDWILHVAEETLCSILRRKSGKHGLVPEDHLNEEDGQLTVHFEEWRHLQLIHFESKRSPYNVWLSDSRTKIRTTIVEGATNAFRQTHGRPFSERTIGCILLITDYDMIFHPSAASSKVTLRVNNLKLHGSEGSEDFGQPLPVEDSGKVHKLLNQITIASPCSTSVECRRSSPIMSQADTEKNDMPISDIDYDSQAAFFTQAPQYKGEKSSIDCDGGMDNKSRYAQSLDRITKHKSAVVEPRRKPDRHAHLLLLLGDKGKGMYGAGPSSPELAETAIRKKIHEAKRVDISHQLSPNISRGINDGKSSIPEKRPPESLSEDCNRPHTGLYADLSPDPFVPQDENPINVSQQALSNVNSDGSGKNRTQKDNWEGSKASLGASLSPSSLIGESCVTTQELKEESFFGSRINRIPLRFVKIPSDQQELLGSIESWLQPSEKKRLYVPLAAMKNLDAFHAQKVSSECVTQNEIPRKDFVKDIAEKTEASPTNSGGNQIVCSSDTRFGALSVSPGQSEGRSRIESVSRLPSPVRGAELLREDPDNSSVIPSEDIILETLPSECPPRQSLQMKTTTHPHSFQGTLRKSITSPSSIQEEMDILDPDYLEDQASSSKNLLGSSSTTQYVPSMTYQSQRTVQVIRTPVATSKHGQSLSPQNSSGTEIRLNDPVIPGTFENAVACGSELANLTESVEPFDSHISSEIDADSPVSLENHPIEESVETTRQLQEKDQLQIQTIESINSSPSFSSQMNSSGVNLGRHSKYKGTKSSLEAPARSPLASKSNLPPMAFYSNQHPNEARHSPKLVSVPVQTSPVFPNPLTGQLKRALLASHEPGAKRRRPNFTEVLVQDSNLAAVDQGFRLSALHVPDTSHIEHHQSDCDGPPARAYNYAGDILSDSACDARLSPQVPSDQGVAVPPPRPPHTPMGALPAMSDSTFSEAMQPFEAPNVFEQFKIAYPSYKGSKKSFIHACAYIEWLRTGRKLHPILWDDFIRVFAEDYGEYVKHCMHAKRDPMPGLHFYNEHIPEPLFDRRLITASSLSEALLLEPMLTARCRKAFENRVCKGENLPSAASISLASANERVAGSQDGSQASSQFPRQTEQITTTTRTNANSNTVESTGTNSGKSPGPISKSQDQAFEKRLFSETPGQNTVIVRALVAESAQRASASAQSGGEFPDAETIQMSNSTSFSGGLSLSPYSHVVSRRENQLSLGEDMPVTMESAKSNPNPVGQRNSRQGHSLGLCSESPILGCQPQTSSGAFISFPNPALDQMHQREPRPKTSPFAIKSLDYEPIGLSGPVHAEIVRDSMWRYDQVPSLLPAKKPEHIPHSMLRLSFDQLVKAYVPRRRRVSKGSTNAPTISSNIPIMSVDDNHIRPTEPETHAWNDK